MAAMTDLRRLFQDVLLDHYRHPRCATALANPVVTVERARRTCGDRVRVELALGGPSGLQLAILTRGCAIATAAGSLLAEWAGGLAPEAVLRGLDTYRAAIESGRVPPGAPPAARALCVLHEFPVRRGCALLPVDALADALSELLRQAPVSGAVNKLQL